MKLNDIIWSLNNTIINIVSMCQTIKGNYIYENQTIQKIIN